LVDLLTAAPTGSTGPFKSTFNAPGTDPLAITLVGDPTQDIVEFGYTNETIITECGDDTAVTGAVDCSKKLFPDPKKANGVCVARDDLFFDIFTATPLCRYLGYSLLVTPTETLAPETKAEIIRLQDGRSAKDFGVLVFGREAAVSEKVYDEIELLNVSIDRIGGIRRENTAFLSGKELMELEPKVHEISIADNVLGVDVIAFAPVAAMGSSINKNVPIPQLLTDRTGTGAQPPKVHDMIRAFLNQYRIIDSRIDSVNISGGPDAIPIAIDSQISALYGITATRFGGADRFETAQIINEKYFPNPTSVVGAMGRPQNIPASSARKERHGPDHYALLWAAFLAANLDNSALQMFDTNTIPGPTTAYITAHRVSIATAWVVGSLAQVSQVTRAAFYSLLN